jgi:cytochrome P450
MDHHPVIEFDPAAGARDAGRSHGLIDELREQYSAFRAEYGFWVLTRHDAIVAAFQDPELFSSHAITVTDPDPAYRWIPEMLDPPEHTTWRRLLRPLFTPKRAAQLQDKIVRRCRDLIDGLAPKGSCDFVEDFARVYPATIFLELMGLPAERLTEFLQWEYAILHQPVAKGRADTRAQAIGQVVGCFTELIKDRRREPRDDIVSQALTFELDERPVTDEELLGLCVLLFLAGLDTVAAAASYAFWHLARHEDDRARIAADDGIIPAAVEELLRAYAIVLPARKVTRDVVHQGCPMKAGDMVMLPIPAATRDPRSFHKPDLVDFDRYPNNHLAFGVGPHRCLGAHLARLELQVALREWHARIPDYGIPAGASVREHAGQVLGLDALPLAWKT